MYKNRLRNRVENVAFLLFLTSSYAKTIGKRFRQLLQLKFTPQMVNVRMIQLIFNFPYEYYKLINGII